MKQPRSRRKRIAWAAILLVWLLAAYWLSSGPATYALVRGWLPVPAYRPVWGVLWRLPSPLAEVHERYSDWWFGRAYRDGFENAGR